MSRATVFVDRLVALLVGLVLLAGGLLAATWGTRQVPRVSGAVDVAALRGATDESWWPWAVGSGGLLLVILGLLWLRAHLPHHAVGRLHLPGGDRTGRLQTETRPVAEAAAAALEPTLGVRRVHGRIRRERGQLVLRLDAALDPDADLTVVTEAAERVSGQVRRMLGREDLTCRVALTVASRVDDRPRVR
jgi:hypothetical protein